MGRTASTWISEIESSFFFGSEEVDDHLSAVQLSYCENKRPRLSLLDNEEKTINERLIKEYGI